MLLKFWISKIVLTSFKGKADESLQFSAGSFLIFLCHINTFGYNPMKLQFRNNVHISSLQDSEVLQAIEELDWNLNSGTDVPAFVKPAWQSSA